jgi:putative YpdA family bacillithiol system oxidoreductase
MYDVIIVGAGPIGLATAIAAQKHGLNYVVVEKGVLANAIYHYPVNMTFFSSARDLEIGNVPFTISSFRPTRTEALSYYRRVAEFFDLSIVFHAEVTSLEKRSDHWSVALHNLDPVAGKNVVVATGYFDNPNTLGVPGEELAKVRHYYQEAHFYYRKKVIIAGGSNSAVEAALEIYRSGGVVTLVHRGPKIGDRVKAWVVPDIENRLKNGEINGYFNSQIVRIEQDGVILRTGEGQELELENDEVLVMIGYHPDTDLLTRAGVQVDPVSRVPAFDSNSLESNRPGLYLAGSLIVGNEGNKIFISNGRHHGEQIITSIVNKK